MRRKAESMTVRSPLFLMPAPSDALPRVMVKPEIVACDLRRAGGTDDYYPANSPEQLAEALTAISKVVGSCTYDTDKEPEDPDNVAVYINKQLIEKDAPDGWKYGASTREIEITGSYCQDILDGKDTQVQILFGCAGMPPFDPLLP